MSFYERDGKRHVNTDTSSVQKTNGEEISVKSGIDGCSFLSLIAPP